MPGRVTVREARGLVSVADPGIDFTAGVIGTASASPIAGGRWSPLYGNPQTMIDDYGIGNGVDGATHSIERTEIPAAFYRVPSSNAGSYGTINNAGVTGTAVPANDTGVDPLGTYQPYGIVDQGGILGIDQIVMKWSLDGGRTLSNPTLLGTATSYTFPNSEAGFLFTPSSTNAAYVALAVELRADSLAHLANVTAHDAADTSASQVVLAASSVPATVAASTAVVNLVLAALLVHVTKITAHDGPDLVAYTALAALVAATDAQTGIDLANAIKAILNTHEAVALAASTAGLMGATASIASPQTYTAASNFLAGGVTALDAQPRRLKFTISGSGTPADMPNSVDITGFDYAGNAQTETALDLTGLGTIISAKAWKGTGLSCAFATGQGTGASFQLGYSNGGHNSADATNTITSANATYGTLVAGDHFETSTVGPSPGLTDLYDGTTNPPTGAFGALSTNDLKLGMVYITSPVAVGDIPTISAGLDKCEDMGKRLYCLVEFRAPNVGESYAAFVVAYQAWKAAVTEDSRISIAVGYAWVNDPITGRRYLRSFAPALLARLVAMKNATDQTIARSPKYVNDGPLEGVSIVDDDGEPIGLDSTQFPGVDDALGVSLYRIPNPEFSSGAYISAHPVLYEVGEQIFSIPARRVANAMERDCSAMSWTQIGGADEVTDGLLSEAAQEQIANIIRGDISRTYAKQIVNAADPDIVTVNQSVIEVGDDIDVEAFVSPHFYGYTRAVTLTFKIRVS